MRFVGLDVHKRVVEAVILDEHGHVLERARMDCARETLLRFCQVSLGKDARVALEATTNTWAVVGVIEPFVAEVVVSNPIRTKAIAEAKVKTDKIDALVLAQLLRCDYLPRVWQPDEHTRLIRAVTSRRASLVGDRTSVKNRIHAVLHQRLIHVEVRDLFGTRGRAWLEALRDERDEPRLDEHGRNALASELRLLDGIEKEIAAIDEQIAKLGYEDPRVKLLMTLPGVDVRVAETLIAALGDVKRFKSGDRAASYLGIVPSTRQSADKCYHGPITKAGRGHARWMMVQAAQHVAAHPGPLGVFFRKLAKKKNRNVAVVATARKLVVIAWHMLTKNEPYRYALPRSTETKLARLRVKATGKKKRGGIAKGTARSATYGQGGTRAIHSLDSIYAAEGLPPIAPLPDGERRMLKQKKVVAATRELRKERRVPRAPQAPKAPTNPVDEHATPPDRPPELGPAGG